MSITIGAHGDNPRDPDAAITAKGDVEPVSWRLLYVAFTIPLMVTHIPGTVVVFSGSDGGNNDNMARQIRGRGYNVLGLYFFGQPGQQQYLSDVPLEFFDEVLAWIKEHGDVQAPITVLGLSKGAELVANLAIRYPEINNIVLYAPAAYNYQGLNFRQRNASLTKLYVARRTCGLCTASTFPFYYRKAFHEPTRVVPQDLRGITRRG